MEPVEDTEFRQAMQELRRKVRGLLEVFPGSNKAQKAIEFTQKQWEEKLKVEPDEARAKRLKAELEKNAELLREELRPGRRAQKENDMER